MEEQKNELEILQDEEEIKEEAIDESTDSSVEEPVVSSIEETEPVAEVEVIEETDQSFQNKRLMIRLIFLLFGFIITTLIYFICKAFF